MGELERPKRGLVKFSPSNRVPGSHSLPDETSLPNVPTVVFESLMVEMIQQGSLAVSEYVCVKTGKC